MALAESFPTARAPRSRMSLPAFEGEWSMEPGARRSVRSTQSSGWRLTRRGRMVVGVLASVPFAAMLVVLGSVSADAGTAEGAAPATGIVVVQAGESLWEIAQQVAPQADPRATITAIRELNGLGGQAVVPGQAIIVPAGG